MGFGTKGYQGFSTNHQSVRYIIGACGSTGNLPCSSAILVPNVITTNTIALQSISLVSQSSKYYGINQSPYFYLATFNITNGSASGYYNDSIIFTNTSNNESSTFIFTDEVIKDTGYGAPQLTSTSMTTQNNYNGETYYTINEGTYSITIGTQTLTDTVTFSQVSIDTTTSVPSQTITVNS